MADIFTIPLTIHRPSIKGISSKITFTSIGAEDGADGDLLKIPFRYAVDEVANKNDLQAIDVLRHATGTVAFSGKQGIQLPRTEKLILLVRRNPYTFVGDDGGKEYEFTEGFTIKVSKEFGIPDFKQHWDADARLDSEDDNPEIYGFDLFDFGILINDGDIIIEPYAVETEITPEVEEVIGDGTPEDPEIPAEPEVRVDTEVVSSLEFALIARF